MSLLTVKDLTVTFGALRALDSVSVEVNTAQIVGIIGPNGAGKSSFFNALSGATRITSGSLMFDGVCLNGMQIHQIAARGISRTFQNIRLFPHMSALDNVLVGEHMRLRSGIFADMIHAKPMRQEEIAAEGRARHLLDFVGLRAAHALRMAGTLAYGEQRRLEIARALAAQPKLIMLDEPAAGLNATEKRDLAQLVRSIADTQIAVLLVEHDMSFVMPLCERLVVLDYGIKIADDHPEVVRANPEVIAAYLGVNP